MTDIEQVKSIIGNKYEDSVIACVLRHTRSVDEAVSYLFDGIHIESWLAKDKRDEPPPYSSSPPKFPPDVSSSSSSNSPNSPSAPKIDNYDSFNSPPPPFERSQPKNDHSKARKSIITLDDYEKLEEPQYDCVCAETFKASEMYFVDCPDNHRFCFDCMKGHIQARLSGSSTVTCPGCKYILKEHEVGHIDRGLKEKYSDLLFKQAINAPGFFNCKCSNTIALNNPSESEHFECKKCNSHWCTLCNETYHYSKNCEEYKKVKHVWDTWKTSGRQQYQMKLKQQEVDFKNKVKEYEVMKKKLEEDQVIAKKNFDILAQDEQKKGATCRRCPNCNRVVERVSGCSSMVCGQDAHGGNTQSGCGKGFNWDSAKPYTPEIPNAPQLNQHVNEAPTKAQGVNHGEWNKCANCHQIIVGIRFHCVNCIGVDYCEKCEATSKHPNQHIFDLVLQAEKM